MSEVPFFDGKEGQDDRIILEEAMQLLEELHERSLHETTEDEAIIAKTEGQLPPQIRRITRLFIHSLAIRKQERFGQEGEEAVQHRIRATRRKFLERVLAESNEDAMLSTRHHPIQAKDHARHLFYLIMRGFMPEDVSAAEFGRLGILSFDLNGLKSFSECTSDEHTTRLLQTTSKIFLHKNGRTRGWAESLGIRMTPFAAGGDEFYVLVDSPQPLAPELLEKIGISFQDEIATDEGLCHALDFDDEEVLIKYKFPPKKRKGFLRLNAAEQAAVLKKIREEAPERFWASIAMGSTTLPEAICRAARKGLLSRTNTALTFDSARQIIFDDLKAISLERREVDKENTKLALQETDPRMADFIIRSRKAREMTKRIRELEEENEELRHALEAMTEQQGKQMRDVLEE